jgi:hypothetical protein
VGFSVLAYCLNDKIRHKWQGDDLVYGVCAAIDEEKDPRCLLLAFHIVELLVQLFPDADGPLASCAEDLFDIISRYFPISFSPVSFTSPFYVLKS